MLPFLLLGLFAQINAALLSIKDFFQKHFKMVNSVSAEYHYKNYLHHYK